MTGSKQQIIITLAGMSWSVAVALMVLASVQDVNHVVMGWSILTALWACVWTGWALLLNERHRVETICRLVLDDDDEPGMRVV